MPQLVSAEKSTHKPKKKQFAFEKLWARAKKLKAQNAKLASDLEKIVVRLKETVLPQELAVVQAQKPLLITLLQMGQRKSMTQWERQVLDEWIREMLEDFHDHNLIDTKLLNYLARYDAFRMGIELDNNNSEPHQQFIEIVQQAENDRQEQLRQEAQATADSINEFREELRTGGHADIEAELDSILGPRPEITESIATDLFADDLAELHQQHQKQYDEERAILRQKMIDDLLYEIDQITGGSQHGSMDGDSFANDTYNNEDGYSDNPYTDEPETVEPQLTDGTFQRLFRATAAKLHPDREADPALRLEKQSLMATLLKARKNGDLLTVLELYENWVGEHAGFSNTDKKSLKHTLKNWVISLEEEQQEIVMQSPLHFRAFNNYHNKSQQKISREISQRIRELQRSANIIEEMSNQITSLKSLKPFLEERYDSSYNFHGFFR